MAKIIILGSANAISDNAHEHTHLVAVGNERVALVDCPSNPILRLDHAGVDFGMLTEQSERPCQ